MTINPEIFWSMLAALCVYGIGKHLLCVALGQLLGGRAKGAISHMAPSSQKSGSAMEVSDRAI